MKHCSYYDAAIGSGQAYRLSMLDPSFMENIMKIHSRPAALALAAGLLAAAEAQAWPMAFDDRPPPNGANGLSANGFSIKGFSSDVTSVKVVVLKDGSRVVLK